MAMSPEEQALDKFNQQLRANPAYIQFLQSMGINPNLPIKMTTSQRKQAEAWVRKNVGDIGNLEIDPAGNANQNEGFGVQAKKWGPIVGGAALTAFGIPGVLPGLIGGGGAAAGSAAGSVAAGIDSGMGVGIGAAPAASGGVLSQIGAHAGDILKGAGAVFGAGSQAAADNRGANANAAIAAEQLNQQRQNNFWEQMLAREQEGRASQSDAFKKLQQSEYLLNNTKDYTPAAGLTAYGFGPHAATEAEKAGAAGVRDAASTRLANGNPLPEVQNPGQFQFDPKLLKAGFWEKFGGLASPALTALGSFGK